MSIGLDHEAGLRVLDLGCGAGYFLAMARHLGHEILGLDLPDNEMYDDFMELFGVHRLDHCKTRLNPGGRIWLELNPGRHKDRYFFLTDETAAGLRRYPGARVSDDKSLITVTVS